MLRRSARADDSAYEPPEPIARMPSSGSMMSPVPEMMNPCSLSATIEQRLEAAKHAIAAPVLRELDRRARHIPGIALELLLELLEKRHGVRRGAGKAGERSCRRESTRTFCALRLHDRLADGHLAVAADGHLAVAPHGENGGRAYTREDA